MALRLPEHWIWDFWFVRDGADVHVLYLKAPRSLGHPELRHANATIGHAVSRDLRTWRVLPDALAAGPPGAFDDLATWTGSVVRHGGRWHLLYTGVTRADHAMVQRIGRASSGDLVRWERHGVVLEAEPRWYETRDGAAAEEHWRDPWVAWDADRARFDMLICARANEGPMNARGVIGHATSPDLRTWRAGPPLSRPGELRQLEVPQLLRLGGVWRILFSATERDHSVARLRRPGVSQQCGTHELRSDARLGPYELRADAFVVGDPVGRYYAARAIEHLGRWWLLAWRMHDALGNFVGELSDPMALAVAPDGGLSVDLAADSDAWRRSRRI